MRMGASAGDDVADCFGGAVSAEQCAAEATALRAELGPVALRAMTKLDFNVRLVERLAAAAAAMRAPDAQRRDCPGPSPLCAVGPDAHMSAPPRRCGVCGGGAAPVVAHRAEACAMLGVAGCRGGSGGRRWCLACWDYDNLPLPQRADIAPEGCVARLRAALVSAGMATAPGDVVIEAFVVGTTRLRRRDEDALRRADVKLVLGATRSQGADDAIRAAISAELAKGVRAGECSFAVVSSDTGFAEAARQLRGSGFRVAAVHNADTLAHEATLREAYGALVSIRDVWVMAAPTALPLAPLPILP